MNDPMREPYATITWCPLDIKNMYPDWTDEQCMEALESVARKLEDRSVEEGWHILDTLLYMWAKNLGDDE